MAAASQATRSPAESIVVRGALAGGVAGIPMAMMAMVWSAAIGTGFWMPLQMIASLPLGDMPSSISRATAIPVGLVTHMAVSMMLGVALAAIVRVVPGARRSAGATVALATAFGAMAWLVNFYVIAPAAGRDWFTDADKPLQLASHAVGFGMVTGVLLVVTGRRPTGGHEGHPRAAR